MLCLMSFNRFLSIQPAREKSEEDSRDEYGTVNSGAVPII